MQEFNQYNRQRYATLKKAGKCIRCTEPNDRKGIHCSKCRADFNTARRERQRKDKHRECYLCTNPKSEESNYCIDCLQEKSKEAAIREADPNGVARGRVRAREYTRQQRVKGFCKNCKRRKALEGKAECEECLARKTQTVNTRRSLSLCPRCGNETEDNVWCSECNRKNREMLKVRGDEINARKRENYKRKREQVIESYGGKCSCPGCEESHVEFLHIDHVNNDGNKARKSNIHSNGKGFLNWIIKNDYPPIFQLLCANCNLAKAFYGSCPHEREYLYHLETGL